MNNADAGPVSSILGGTGAIGMSLAGTLVRRGHQIVSAGRNLEKLDALASEHRIDSVTIDINQRGSVDAAIRMSPISTSVLTASRTVSARSS